MKPLVLILLVAFFISVQSFAQSKPDTLSVHEVTESTLSLEKSVMTDAQRRSLIFDAGDCFKMSGYMQYAAIGTGVLAGVVAIVASNKENVDARDKMRSVAYLVGGFAVAFEVVSITYKIRGGRRLKLAATPDGASVALKF